MIDDDVDDDDVSCPSLNQMHGELKKRRIAEKYKDAFNDTFYVDGIYDDIKNDNKCSSDQKKYY